MNQNCQSFKTEQKKGVQYKNGKIYFSKETERKFFFILTVIMLLVGFFAKIGLF